MSLAYSKTFKEIAFHMMMSECGFAGADPRSSEAIYNDFCGAVESVKANVAGERRVNFTFDYQLPSGNFHVSEFESEFATDLRIFAEIVKPISVMNHLAGEVMVNTSVNMLFKYVGKQVNEHEEYQDLVAEMLASTLICYPDKQAILDKHIERLAKGFDIKSKTIDVTHQKAKVIVEKLELKRP